MANRPRQLEEASRPDRVRPAVSAESQRRIPAMRFVDDGNYLSAYAGKVYVRCVRCDSPGAVRAESRKWQWIASFDCAGCGLQLSSTRGDWVGPVRLLGRRPCGYCGHKWLRSRIGQTGWPRDAMKNAIATCPECGHDSTVPLEVHRNYDGAEGIDPHFGMQLLLADSGRDGALWAYNAEHIDILRAYVSATLRERSANAGNASMFSRLPAWLKSAKNRRAAVSRLDKLKRLLPDPSGKTCPGKPGHASHVKR